MGCTQPPPDSRVHSSTVFWPTSPNSMCLPLPRLSSWSQPRSLNCTAEEALACQTWALAKQRDPALDGCCLKSVPHTGKHRDPCPNSRYIM